MKEEEQLVPEDDVVIGKAFRGSVLVILALGLILGGVFLFLRRPQEEAPEVVIETEAPVAVQREVEMPTVAFTDITAEAGIRFEHLNGATGE